MEYTKTPGINEQQSILNAAEINQDPSPTFDIETNQEDKDRDIENPSGHKDYEKDNSELVPPDPDKK